MDALSHTVSEFSCRKVRRGTSEMSASPVELGGIQTGEGLDDGCVLSITEPGRYLSHSKLRRQRLGALGLFEGKLFPIFKIVCQGDTPVGFHPTYGLGTEKGSRGKPKVILLFMVQSVAAGESCPRGLEFEQFWLESPSAIATFSPAVALTPTFRDCTSKSPRWTPFQRGLLH